MTPGPRGGRVAPETLLSGVDLLLLDLDGVLYAGPHAVPGAVEVLRAADVARVFVTNNASRPPRAVAEHLVELGIDAHDDQVTTSAQAGAALLAQRLKPGATVLAVGGPGVEVALAEAGLVAVRTASPPPDGVLQGFGREVGWAQLCDATVAVAAGALWVATNTDMTIPTERGTMPGNGTMIAAVRTATGVDPLVAGKPQPDIFTAEVEAAGSTAPLAIGDRLDTDIAGARAAGIDVLLVLTGVSSPLDAVTAPEALRPTHLGLDLRALERAPVAPRDVPVIDGRRTLRRASAWLEGDVVRSEVADGESAGAPDDPAVLLDLLAVVCAAAWTPADGSSPEPDEATARSLTRLRDLAAPRREA